jgi:hypothetical protein
MARKHARVLCGCLMALAALFVVGGLSGCGGDANAFGEAAGWVYQPTGGGQPIISASPTPPAGYQPVSDADVSIDEHPELTNATDDAGAYLITNIPPGTQTLVVTVPGQTPLTVSIPIIANHVTLGSGHQEGGGGIG